MVNEEIRRKARERLIPLWKIAKRLGISEPTMTRWMREELSENNRQRVMETIEELSKEEI